MMLAVKRKQPKYCRPVGALGSSYPSKSGRDILDLIVGATRNLPAWNGKNMKENKADAELIENGSGSVGVKKDGVVGGAPPEALTEEDTQDIVRRVRELLRKQGPSQESELLAVLRPQQVRRLRASFDSLAALVERLPGFHHVREDRYSFLYYLSPEEDDCCSAPPDGLPPEHGSPVANEGAEQAGEGAKRDACSQTPCSKRAELECEVKERAREVAQLEHRLEAVRLDQARKREALRFKIEQHRILRVTLPPMPSLREEDDEESDQKSSSRKGKDGKEKAPLHAELPLRNDDKHPEAEECTEEAEQEEEEEEPHTDPGPRRTTPASFVVEGVHEMLGVRSPVPDFYDLHMRLEWSSSDTESLWSGWGSHTRRRANKAEAQIAKIIKMLIKRQPNYTEVEMRRWVDEVRLLKGGFSQLTFNAIVAMVLDHMRKGHCLRRHNNKR